MYNRVNHDPKQGLTLKSYIIGIKTSIFAKRYYDNIFSEKLVNELHEWIDKFPNAAQSSNVSYSLIFKINVTIVKKQKHILKISVQDMHNDMILPIYQGGFLVQEPWMEKYL